MAEDEPKYIEIADDLAQQIRTGEWEPGQKLPGQREYAEAQRVSEQTVTRAYDLLVRQGLIRTERYKGSYVADAPVHDIDSANWWEREDEKRFPGGRTRWTVLDAGQSAPEEVPPEIRDALALEDDEGAVWRIQRLLDAGQPVKWDQCWWQGRLLDAVPELADSTPVTDGTDRLIEERTGRRTGGGRDRMRARGASAEDAERLGISRGQPVLEVWRYAHDTSGEPLLVEVDVYRGLMWCNQDPYKVEDEDESEKSK